MPIQSPGGTREASNLFEVQQSVRDGIGCTRHRRLQGDWLSKWTVACGAHCSHLMGKVYHRFSRRVALSLLFVLTIAHPVLHPFEGGALDAFLGILTVRAFDAES